MPGSPSRSAALYFLVPLIATFEFAMRIRRGRVHFDAFEIVLNDQRFQATFTYSTLVALATIVVGMLLVVPTAYWVRLRLPQLRPMVEFVTLLPLVIPAIVLVFGYLRMYNCVLAPAPDRQRPGHQHPADVRVRGARAAVHVPVGRYGPAARSTSTP